jgi:hypothetical protein
MVKLRLNMGASRGKSGENPALSRNGNVVKFHY